MAIRTKVAAAASMKRVAPKIRGWAAYYHLCEAKAAFERFDGWLRHRIRCLFWRHWKRSWTRYKELRKRGLSRAHAWISSRNGRGPWLLSRMISKFCSTMAGLNEFFPRSGGEMPLTQIERGAVGRDGKSRLVAQLVQLVKRFLSRKFLHKQVLHYSSLWHSANLTKLAELHQCDKGGVHFYTPHYQRIFEKTRLQPLRLLEIGVGGYAERESGGNSLRMWKYFFPKAEIFSIDIEDKRHLAEERIHIFQGSQNDGEFLARVVAATGPLDIIVDDGSHRNDHVIFSFEKLFPSLKPGGWYVVEDTQTSYWPAFGGCSQDLLHRPTTMNYFKSLTDGLNYSERISPGYKPTFTDLNIVSLHFFHNLIFVERGPNHEPSNVLLCNRWPA